MFEFEKSLIDQHLLEITSKYTEIKESIEYSLLGNGKRFRALLVLLVLKDLDLDINIGLDVSCALEMIHCYSLIHDDLPAMDNDEFRRGKLTNHIVYGEDVALLAGDALLTEAFFQLAITDLPSDKKIEIIKNVSKLAGANGMIRGQYLDLRSKDLTLEVINTIHDCKTKDLIEAALVSGAIIGDQNIEEFREIAKYLGRAFQIKDDLDDIKKNEPTTIIRVLGTEKAQTMLIEYRLKCLNLIESILGRKDLYKLVELIIWKLLI